ncbi:MAG: hypothetical protein HYW13_07090 [Planctomycetes bacterium]|nr:hypothetical protein [Planctomycetota bacterium]
MNKWILLIHQIAQDAPNFRVKVWRILKKNGAVLIRNAVYALPYTKDHEEIMQWISKQIKDGGSDASLFITESLDKEQDAEIIKAFQDSCNKAYLALIEPCNNLQKKIEQIEETKGTSNHLKHELTRELSGIMKNYDDVDRVD